MFNHQKEILFTVVLVITMTGIIILTKRALRRFSFIRSIEINRRKIILNLSYLFIYGIAISILAVIWGVDYRQFIVFISSVLAVLGIGFFAQWSLLSSLTASVILFFSHPVRIGDKIRVLDKDFDWTGELVDITGFYLFIRTDDGKNITLPNSLVIQKGIEIVERKKDKE
ncbi:mechanosensitive ion channel [Aquimarina litoralis]|uniref:Mechanosensitive ion channel n=1 Tax=Aquimarina litoralis TaxID=584605 RepID=A0ABP3TMD0_9FLAO